MYSLCSYQYGLVDMRILGLVSSRFYRTEEGLVDIVLIIAKMKRLNYHNAISDIPISTLVSQLY